MTNPLDTLPAISARNWLRVLNNNERIGIVGLEFDQHGADACFWYIEAEKLVTLTITDDITPDVLARVIALRDAQEAEAEARDGGGFSAGAIMTTKDLGFECEMHGFYLEKYLTGRGWHVYSVWTDGEYGSPQS